MALAVLVQLHVATTFGRRCQGASSRLLCQVMHFNAAFLQHLQALGTGNIHCGRRNAVLCRKSAPRGYHGSVWRATTACSGAHDRNNSNAHCKSLLRTLAFSPAVSHGYKPSARSANQPCGLPPPAEWDHHADEPTQHVAWHKQATLRSSDSQTKCDFCQTMLLKPCQNWHQFAFYVMHVVQFEFYVHA